MFKLWAILFIPSVAKTEILIFSKVEVLMIIDEWCVCFYQDKWHDLILKSGSSWITLWSKAIMKCFYSWSLVSMPLCRIWYLQTQTWVSSLFNNNFLLCLLYKFMIDVYVRGLMLLRLPWTIANDLIISIFNTHTTPQFIILTLEGDKAAWVWGPGCHNLNSYTN